MAKKQSTIVYDQHVEICSEYLTDEQFGRLMFALVKGEEPDFGDDQLLAMAFAFISLQKDVDDAKYERKCEQNRKNGAKGGRPKKSKEKPKKANGFFENPNDNENENEKYNDNGDDTGFSGQNPEDHDDVTFFGSFENVRLTETEHAALKQHYERANDLIEKVSVWLRTAKRDVPDHYALCVKFASNDKWPKRRQIEPVELPRVEDPISDEDRERMIAQMKAGVNAAFSSG